MSYLARFCLALAAVAAAACTPPRSLSSLVTDESRHFDARVLGDWLLEDGDKVTLARVTADGKGYRLEIRDEAGFQAGDPDAFQVTLFGELTQIGEVLMLDVMLHPEVLAAFPHADLVVPVHYFTALAFLDADRAAITPFYPEDEEAFEESLAPAFTKLPDRRDGDSSWRGRQVLMTHPSDALRKHMARWLAEPGHLMDEAIEFRRVTTPR